MQSYACLCSGTSLLPHYRQFMTEIKEGNLVLKIIATTLSPCASYDLLSSVFFPPYSRQVTASLELFKLLAKMRQRNINESVLSKQLLRIFKFFFKRITQNLPDSSFSLCKQTQKKAQGIGLSVHILLCIPCATHRLPQDVA